MELCPVPQTLCQAVIKIAFGFPASKLFGLNENDDKPLHEPWFIDQVLALEAVTSRSVLTEIEISLRVGEIIDLILREARHRAPHAPAYAEEALAYCSLFKWPSTKVWFELELERIRQEPRPPDKGCRWTDLWVAEIYQAAIKQLGSPNP